jgi:hypothetical protein
LVGSVGLEPTGPGLWRPCPRAAIHGFGRLSFVTRPSCSAAPRVPPVSIIYSLHPVPFVYRVARPEAARAQHILHHARMKTH